MAVIVGGEWADLAVGAVAWLVNLEEDRFGADMARIV